MKTHWIALLPLLAFSLYTGWTLFTADQSLIAFGLELMSRQDTAQVVIDLYLMAALACLWMLQDARSRGVTTLSVLPYLLVTVVFVSIGPLLYLVVRGLRSSAGNKQR
ncbi:DUF2834 domain-containing protein [Pseudomonas alkylphenolica]|uniref:DUF2834 domain-containing protein n=1 Tax=Pseudomonas alkylphenolica TaxID=237609 RepID=A0A443ZEL7_9PSED|nr:DUF2834 domain-containing protein [Pseudomonas alkylphenolica]RWU17138.1 DUF2834 domain-containing protein [Pseudomonas alkylphenolica]